MADGDFTLKTGDSWPPLIRVLEDDNGPMDLSGALSIRIVARNGITLVTDSCVVMTIAAALATGWLKGTWDPGVLAVSAAVKWDIDPADTAVPGPFPFEYEITWAAGNIETVPNSRDANPTMQIDKDLDTP